jgi:hypothetical protein
VLDNEYILYAINGLLSEQRYVRPEPDARGMKDDDGLRNGGDLPC